MTKRQLVAMSRIVISYRRKDTAGYVRLLYERLSAEFEGEQIFLDIRKIEIGEDFVEAIERAIAASDVVIAIIGPRWVTIADADGNRRLDNPHDHVRLEIALALKHGKRVVPVLVSGARMPSPEELPEELVSICRRNALSVSEEWNDTDVDRLVDTLHKFLRGPDEGQREEPRSGRDAASSKADSDESESAELDDIFDSLFGDDFGKKKDEAGGRPGADLRYDLEIGLEEAVLGATVEIEVMGFVQCTACGGNGTADGAAAMKCKACKGTGRIARLRGLFKIEQVCPECSGAGLIISNPCATCLGKGRYRGPKRLNVRVPAGVDSGHRIPLKGQGDAGLRGAAPGDLLVLVQVKGHPLFRREGLDLHIHFPLSRTFAQRGGSVRVPALGKRTVYELSVPSNTVDATRLRLRGKGVKSDRSDRTGDLYVIVELYDARRESKSVRKRREAIRRYIEGLDV